MYTNDLFRKMFLYAEKLHPKMIFILSAKYGLLKPDDVIEPYEKTLKNMRADEKRAWTEAVITRLRQEADLQKERFIFLAGAPYREGILPYIVHHEVPMEGLSFGRQLRWLAERTS